MQRHLGGDARQRLHQEVRRAHACLDRAERVLDRLAALTHLLRMLIEPALHRFQHMLMLPSGDPSFLAGRATVFDGAALTGVGPVAAHHLAVLLVRVVVREAFTGRTNINVFLSYVAEVLFAEAAFRLRVRGHRLRQRHRDVGLFARQDLLAVEVAAIGDGFELLRLQSCLRV